MEFKMKQNFKSLLALLGLSSFLTCANAVPCIITIVKSDCWGDYNVHVELSEQNTNVLLADVVLPKNISFQRIQLDCKPLQEIVAKASFSPEIFEDQKGHFFAAKKAQKMPDTLPSPGSAWAFNLCYPSDFSNLPSPLKATGSCACDYSRLPTIKIMENPVK